VQPWQGLGFETVDDSKVVEQKISARRRLIRGAFVAPAALTLFSGSAFAQASMTCVSKRVADPVLPLDSGTPVVYLRVPLYGLGNGGNVSTWVSGADVVPLAHESDDPFLSSTSHWMCVSNGQGDPNGRWKVGEPLKYEPKLPDRRGPKLIPEQWAVVRVDATGHLAGIVGVGDHTGTSAVGWDSCWASFAGVTRFN
jgi:hypothetical protein